jgi:ADP-ribose pyrophosphatase YjhB (NUDIX family)
MELPMTPAQQIALWADRLRDISALGLHFAHDPYDTERYRVVQDLALEMLAFATAEPLEHLEPLRAPIFARPTPLTVGDAAIIDTDGRMLLILRADNQLWAMPGGALEVGETPAEGVVREAQEETGILCEPIALVGVFDSRYCGSVSRHHLYQFVFLCKPLGASDTISPTQVHEVLASQWFTEDSLQTSLAPGHAQRIEAAFQVWREQQPAYFDRR